MRKVLIVIIVMAVLLVAGGVLGNALTDNRSADVIGSYRSPLSLPEGRMHNMFDQYTGYGINKDDMAELEELEELVHLYIDRFDENLEISDVFVYDDSDYYYSIVEGDTGMGAMELLVNPYTGTIRPEFGPNMMWNIKYGMHAGSGMGGRGIMSGRFTDFSYSVGNTFEKNAVSWEEALALASAYVERNSNEGYDVADEGHEFYGYYTFHIEQNGETTGMISVNGLSGDVWYHDWHGTVIKIIEGHSN